MRILIDIGHPAHVHLFKNLVYQMKNEGHQFIFTLRQGECEEDLLRSFNFEYVKIGAKKRSKIGKTIGLLTFSFKILIIGRKFKADMFLSHGSMYAGIAACILRKTHIALEDSGNMEQIRLSRPFSSVILSPQVLPLDLGEKHLKYKGYHELAYLHPRYFKPDMSILEELNIGATDQYCILRFVSWKATHDSGQKGFTLNEKKTLISMLTDKMKVFISSESDLNEEFKQYKLTIAPEKIHDALYFASLVISEGATIASEAGVLGTTALYVNSISRAYCADQEKFGLVYNFRDSNQAITKTRKILMDNKKLTKQTEGREMLLADKIDVTSFLIWFIKSWPDSLKIMKNDPDYQERFK